MTQPHSYPPHAYPTAAPIHPRQWVGQIPHQRLPYPPPSAGVPGRPGTVLAGLVMAYVGAGLQLLLGLVAMVGSRNDDFVRGFATGAGTAGQTGGAIAVIGGIVALVGIAVLVLAVFAQRGGNVARIGLTVFGGVSMLLQLVSLVGGSPQSVIGLLWIATAVTLIWAGPANAWYRQQARDGDSLLERWS